MLIVTATNLPRLMQCNGSILMAGSVPAVGVDNSVRDEGNAAHWVIEEVHSGKRSLEELIDRKAPNNVYVTPEMAEHCEEFLTLIGTGGFVEYASSFRGDNWQINSRADHDGLKFREAGYSILRVDDFKYGWGIVDVKENWTLIANALSFCINNNIAPNEIIFTIHQPRPDHPEGKIREWRISYAELINYYNQISATLSNPSNVLNTGKECYKCPAMAICPAAWKAQLNAIDASEIAFKSDIDNEELSFKLDHIARAMAVLKQGHDAYSELALHRIKEGQLIKNYSMDSQISNRAWMKYVTAEVAMIMTGKDLTKKDLVTPAQAEKLGVSKDVVNSMCERNQKGVKLVRIDDNKKAAKMFK